MSALDLLRRHRGLHVAGATTEDPRPYPAYQEQPAVPENPWVRAELNRIAAEAHRERLAYEHARWYGWGDTTMDYPPAQDRPYVPQPCPLDPAYVPESYRRTRAEDIRDLPEFRGTLRARARFFHRGCQCERWSTTGSAGWLAGQYAEVTAKPALSWWTLRVPPAVQSDDTLTWGRAA